MFQAFDKFVRHISLISLLIIRLIPQFIHVVLFSFRNLQGNEISFGDLKMILKGLKKLRSL